jgi:hypothetical protein
MVSGAADASAGRRKGRILRRREVMGGRMKYEG